MCAGLGLWYALTPGLTASEPASQFLTLSAAFDPAEYLRWEFAYALAVTVAGGLLQGFTGFGSTLVMVPLLTFVYGPAESVVVGIGLSALGSLQLLPEASRDADWPDVFPACLAILVAAPVGAYLLLSSDPEITRRLMGGVVILVALIMIRGWNYTGPRNVATSAAFGGFSGFTGGFFGMGAPGVTIYYLSGTVRAAIQRANILIVLGVVSSTTVVAVSLGGGSDWGSLIFGALLFIPFSIPMWIGAHVFRRASNEVYRQVCLWLLIIMGITVILL